MAHGRNGTVVLEVTLAEMPSSARLWETEQTLQGRGGETHSGMCAGAGGGVSTYLCTGSGEWAW